jgi:alpha-ketoglutarate-dependent taurine dioxygenase
MQNLNERFEKLVKATQTMRSYQKRYFKYRTSDDLKKAKYYESVVDKLLTAETPTVTQTNLFKS